MYRPPNQGYVPVYQTTQSLLYSNTSPQSQADQQHLHQTVAVPPPPHYQSCTQQQTQPQLQPQQALLPVFHHAASIQYTAPAGSLSSIAAAPSPGTATLGHGSNVFGTPSSHSMPMSITSESPSYVKPPQASPEEKNSRPASSGGVEDMAYVLQLRSKDFYSPAIQQFLGKHNVQIEEPSPTTPATPSTPVKVTSAKAEPPEIMLQEVTVKQPLSKRALQAF